MPMPFPIPTSSCAPPVRPRDLFEVDPSPVFAPNWWEVAKAEAKGDSIVCPSTAFPSLASLAVASLVSNNVALPPETPTEIHSQIQSAIRWYPYAHIPPRSSWGEEVVRELHTPLDPIPEGGSVGDITGPAPAITVGVDLMDGALRVFALAEEIEGVPELADHFGSASERFHKFMTLLASRTTGFGVVLPMYRDEPCLIPALDILSIWFSLIIRTDLYKAYCLQTFGKLIDRRGPLVVLDKYGKALTEDDDLKVAGAIAHTQAVWEETFPGETPYHVNLAELWDAVPEPSVERPIPGLARHEYVHDRDWFGGLLSIVGPVGHSALQAGHKPYVARLIRSYERFLYLMAEYPEAQGSVITVAYDADLVWHAHQIHPLVYHMDCMRLLSREAPHIPWPDTPADVEALSSLWESEFGDAFVH